ncbi:MAG: hypothetical protein ACXWYS_05295 [Gaiellaceae bacterium]
MLSSPRRRRRITYLGGMLGVVGIIATLVVVLPDDNGDNLPEAREGKPTLVEPAPKPVKLARADAKAARAAAAKFVATAVLRRNIEESWELTAPVLKAGYTRATWKRGEIPVVPFPADDLDEVRWRLDYSITNHVGLQVAMLPLANSRTKALLFEMELVRAGPASNRRWLVDYWAPLGPGADSPSTRIRQQLAAGSSSNPNTISGSWLAAPVVAVFGTLFASPIALTVRGRLRHRRAERDYRARLGEPRV